MKKIPLSPRPRRVLYVALYEAFAILLSAALLLLFAGGSSQTSLFVAVLTSIIAVIWNYLFNSGFEWWEKQRGYPPRTKLVRIVHGTMFEGGLTFICVPLYMLVYSIGFLHALSAEISILVFFLVYTVAFTWIFDFFFALPADELRNKMERAK